MKESYTIPNKLISDINSLKKSAKRLTENVETLDKPRKGVALLEALKESKNYSAFYTDANKNVKQLTVSNGKVTLTGIGGNQSLANVAFKTNANGTAEQVKVVHAAALKGIDTLSKVTGLPWVLDDNLDEAVSKKDTVSGNDIALKY